MDCKGISGCLRLGAEVGIIRAASGFVREAGAFLKGAAVSGRAGGEGAEIGAGFAIIIFGDTAGEAGVCAGFTAHGTAV